MKHKDEEKVQSSLIPGIRHQEGQLQEALQAAQQEAEKLLVLAGQEAKTSIEEARRGFSESVDRLRTAGLETLKANLETEKAGLEAHIQEFESQVSARLPEAVQRIMSLVLPGGKTGSKA